MATTDRAVNVALTVIQHLEVEKALRKLPRGPRRLAIIRSLKEIVAEALAATVRECAEKQSEN
jgi:hypothetical protein